VLLVTGDDAVCDEAKELLGDALTTVAVKRGLGKFSARNLAPKRARELIEEGAKRALSDLKAVAPYDPGRPCEVRVEFKETQPAEEHARRPGVERIDPRTTVSRADDWWTAWSQFFL
jgi:D-amino peptidase